MYPIPYNLASDMCLCEACFKVEGKETDHFWQEQYIQTDLCGSFHCGTYSGPLIKHQNKVGYRKTSNLFSTVSDQTRKPPKLFADLIFMLYENIRPKSSSEVFSTVFLWSALCYNRHSFFLVAFHQNSPA